MTDNASSSRPGFSYLVGPTDNVNRLLQNLRDTGSCGGDGILGRFRSEEYDGGRREEFEVRDNCCDNSDCCNEDRLDGVGEPDLDRERVAESWLSRVVLNSCSNCLVSSTALNSRIGCCWLGGVLSDMVMNAKRGQM